eukprot:1316539-Pleurochrysis_carterae.AAC.1
MANEMLARGALAEGAGGERAWARACHRSGCASLARSRFACVHRSRSSAAACSPKDCCSCFAQRSRIATSCENGARGRGGSSRRRRGFGAVRHDAHLMVHSNTESANLEKVHSNGGGERQGRSFARQMSEGSSLNGEQISHVKKCKDTRA